MSLEVKLPKQKIKASEINPRVLLVYSAPKVGKTTLMAGLENNLIIDLEKGTDYVDAMKIKVDNLKELDDVCVAIEKKIEETGEYPYDYITIDTVTKLEEWCEGLATKMYKASNIGKKFTGDSVLELPNGAGYQWLRKAFFAWLERVAGLTNKIIFVGHLKDKFLTEASREVSSVEIDLTGKIRNIVSQKADAICHLYRKDNEVYANFDTSEQVSCGTRSAHLSGQKFVISEKQEDGTIITYWDKIFK